MRAQIVLTSLKQLNTNRNFVFYNSRSSQILKQPPKNITLYQEIWKKTSRIKKKMKGKTEQFVSSNYNNPLQVDKEFHDNFYGKSLSVITGHVGVSSSSPNWKMMKKSSQFNKSWNMGSLMAELPSSPPIDSDNESPNHPRHSCRPSTVFYSPRYQEMKTSSSFSDLKKQFPNCIDVSSSYESSKQIGVFGGVQSNGYEPSIDFSDCKWPATGDVIDKRGITDPKCDEFRGAIPVIDEEQSENRSLNHLKPYQEFLDEVHNQKQTEVDAIKKATYTRLLRKLTKKEDVIDEWELKRRTKVEFQLDKLERKLEQRRAEAVQKVNKKLAETKEEAQKRKAKARRVALKEMAKYCSQIN